MAQVWRLDSGKVFHLYTCAWSRLTQRRRERLRRHDLLAASWHFSVYDHYFILSFFVVSSGVSVYAPGRVTKDKPVKEVNKSKSLVDQKDGEDEEGDRDSHLCIYAFRIFQHCASSSCWKIQLDSICYRKKKPHSFSSFHVTFLNEKKKVFEFWVCKRVVTCGTACPQYEVVLAAIT